MRKEVEGFTVKQLFEYLDNNIDFHKEHEMPKELAEYEALKKSLTDLTNEIDCLVDYWYHRSHSLLIPDNLGLFEYLCISEE